MINNKYSHLIKAITIVQCAGAGEYCLESPEKYTELKNIAKDALYALEYYDDEIERLQYQLSLYHKLLESNDNALLIKLYNQAGFCMRKRK